MRTQDRHRQRLRGAARAAQPSPDRDRSGSARRLNYNAAHATETCLTLAAALGTSVPLWTGAQQRARPRPADAITILKPARVFDGEAMHEGWAVRVKGERIDAVGPEASVAAAGAKVIDLPGTTLMPGLVEGHSHILLHAYSETSWNDQVSKEGLALRVARATNHLRATLMAGFTTVRDLGTEGAGYADVELRDAVRQGIIPGPRVLASTRAIVATGSYQPKASCRSGACRRAPRRPTASTA